MSELATPENSPPVESKPVQIVVNMPVPRGWSNGTFRSTVTAVAAAATVAGICVLVKLTPGVVFAIAGILFGATFASDQGLRGLVSYRQSRVVARLARVSSREYIEGTLTGLIRATEYGAEFWGMQPKWNNQWCESVDRMIVEATALRDSDLIVALKAVRGRLDRAGMVQAMGRDEEKDTYRAELRTSLTAARNIVAPPVLLGE